MKTIKVPFDVGQTAYYTFSPTIIYKVRLIRFEYLNAEEIIYSFVMEKSPISGTARWYKEGKKKYNLFETAEQAKKSCKEWQDKNKESIIIKE